MMKTNKLKDERIEQLTGVVCRRGFRLLSLGIALDLMGKLALWRPGQEGMALFPAVGLEALVLLAALVYVMGAAARQGVLLTLEGQETPRLPRKVYLRCAGWTGGFLLGSLLLRMAVYPHWEAGFAAFLLVIGSLLLVSFLLAFGVCLLVYRLALASARKAWKRMEEDD